MTIAPQLIRFTADLPAWGTATAPPKEFCIFNFGANRGTQWGQAPVDYFLTEANANAIVLEWARRGITGAGDYEHSVTTPATGQPKPASCHFSIEVRTTGLWAVNVIWTKRALTLFKDKEYRYFSPLFGIKKDANGVGQIVSLANIALTNWPATDRQRPLIALSQKVHRSSIKMTAEEFLALADEIIGAAEGNKEKREAVAFLLSTKMAGAPAPEAPPADPADGMPEAAAVAEVAQAAFAATGFKAGQHKECIGGLKALSTLKTKFDLQTSELTTIKHTQAVDAAIAARKLAPGKRADALAMNSAEFTGFIKLSSAIVDVADVQTPITSSTLADKAKAAINPDMIAYANKMGLPVEDVAQNWVASYGTEVFKL